MRPRRAVEAFDDTSHPERRIDHAGRVRAAEIKRGSRNERDARRTAGRARSARTDPARRGRGDRRRQRRRHRVEDDVRRAQRRREPARQRALRRGRPRRRAPRVVRTELARGAGHDPRRPQARPRRGAALVPLHRRGDGVRHRQLRRDDGRRRRRAGAARRGGPRPDPEGARGRRVRRPDARRAARRGPICSRGQPDTEPAATADPVRGRRGDDLHVGHDGEAEGRAAHANRPRARVRAARPSSTCCTSTRCTSRPVRSTTPARSRSRRCRTRSAHRSSCCASSTPRGGSSS